MVVDLGVSEWRTAIIPVQKWNSGKYSIVVDRRMWNVIQVLILKGAEEQKTIIEFKIEEVKQ